MYNRRSIIRLTLLACAIGAGIAVACGPDFPPQLLDDRAGALKSTPANSFNFEASRLVVPADALRAQESGVLPDGSYPQDAIPEDFDPTLNAAQRAVAHAMRALPDGDQAYAAGSALPEALRLYTAAAVDIRSAAHGDSDAALARARARLLDILALPGREGSARSVWAAYMLAEIGLAEIDANETGDTAGMTVGDASAAYARVRRLAQDGAPDPLGLAVASYGQEARLLLIGTHGSCAAEDFLAATACPDTIPARALKQAIRLYAEQAARGSRSGQSSLRLIADWALGTPSRARQLIDDPVAQRLLVAYALARVGDIVDGNPESAFDMFATFDQTGQRGYADAGTGARNVTPNPALQALATALAKQDVSRIEDADRVAALAYRVGRYDLAQGLAGRLDTPLAWWVRAKLAIRQGDMPAAAQAYARAASAFPTAAGLEAPGVARLKAEQGVLALSRGQYVEALDMLLHASLPDAGNGVQEEGWPLSPYWNDAAYVAERVLTADELKAYVDQQVPASAVLPAPAGFAQFDYQPFYDWMVKHPIPDGDRLRTLLARRLMREGRIDQALAYFPQDDDARFATMAYDDGSWRVTPSRSHRHAVEYTAALQQAGSAWGRTARAEAWFKAAQLARRNGLEIMGYEQDPDFAVYDGNYTYGAGRSPEPWRQGTDGSDPLPQDTPAQRADAALPGPLVTPDERLRFAASEAKPYARFHYRQVAADHTLESAALLPNRSQAFAAVLCQGARYIIDDSPERAQALYQRYIAQGAQVPFSATFGRECPPPDFQAAAWFHYTQAWKAWERLRRDHGGLLLAAGLLMLLAGGACVFAWRHSSAPRQPKANGRG
ncbi:hypothetical protein [Achromobacter sp. UMC46]|uniref:hypothetical protein n=1 Tax=Achromobacter sp. UMC46 TaxID=1862319 RepID=UPI001603AA4B|nr:hypothetical protein [Achromobacter sp. UMC46]MBB1595568.1 hypothetical protein [Achromobacter sp. UMC46]